MHREGWVYVLENEAILGRMKIGFTTREPEIRAKELSQPTGVPASYQVVHKRWFADCIAAERDFHRTLGIGGPRKSSSGLVSMKPLGLQKNINPLRE